MSLLANFRMIHDPKTDTHVCEAYIGIPEARLFITGSRSTYAAARELARLKADERSIRLDTFDGEWSQTDAGPVKIGSDFLRGMRIKHGSQVGLHVDYVQVKHGATWVVARNSHGDRFDLLASECSMDRD